MTTVTLVTVALIIGIAAGGLCCVFLFRRQVLSIGLLTLGAALLAYGHVQWSARHESPEIKEAMFIRHIVAGWALVGMGFVGTLHQRGRSKDDDV